MMFLVIYIPVVSMQKSLCHNIDQKGKDLRKSRWNPMIQLNF